MQDIEVQKTEIEIIEEVAQKIQEIEEKCKELSVKYKKSIEFETFSERDSEGRLTGKVFAAYIQQPHILVKARCMDMMIAGKLYEAGLALWDASILPESDKEISSNETYKIGLVGKLGLLLDAQAPDIKKK